jgi:hypothetical protein
MAGTSTGTAIMDKIKEFSHMDLVPIAFNVPENDSCTHNDRKTL